MHFQNHLFVDFTRSLGYKGQMAERLEEIVAERRLGEASSAYSFYEQMLHDDRTRQQSFAKITNQLNGGRPFDQNKLVEIGQGWLAISTSATQPALWSRF